jgi:hypothetical protein
LAAQDRELLAQREVLGDEARPRAQRRQERADHGLQKVTLVASLAQ